MGSDQQLYPGAIERMPDFPYNADIERKSVNKVVNDAAVRAGTKVKAGVAICCLSPRVSEEIYPLCEMPLKKGRKYVL